MPTEQELDEREQRRIAAAERHMREEGQATEAHIQDDYFGCDDVHNAMLPDGISFVQHKTFTEGERRKYLNRTNRAVTLKKASGDAQVRMQPGDERYALLDIAVCGWNLLRAGQAVPFSEKEKGRWLDSAPPHIVDIVQKDIYKHNPWLLSELSADDIRKQIVELDEMLVIKEREEEGKADS